MENTNKSSISESFSINKNKFLILVINVVSWIFIPITAIIFVLYLFINSVINIYNSKKFLSICNNMNISFIIKEVDVNVSELIRINPIVLRIKSLLCIAMEELSNFTGYLDSNVDKVMGDMINESCNRISKILGEINSSNCDAKLLKEVKKELDSILNTAVSVINSLNKYGSTSNLFFRWSIFNLNANFCSRILNIFDKCQREIDILVKNQHTSSSIDDPSVSSSANVARSVD